MFQSLETEFTFYVIGNAIALFASENSETMMNLNSV